MTHYLVLNLVVALRLVLVYLSLNFEYHMVNWMTVTLNVYLNFELALLQKMSDLKLILFGLLVISYALIR